MLWAALLVLGIVGCRPDEEPSPPPPVSLLESQPGPESNDPLVRALRDQLTWGTTYNGAYVSIPYPGGDVPRTQGVCTDVVIRAYRAIGQDLQQLVHEDAKANRSAYPRIDQLDRNIDHRRCPNLISYFRRHAEELPLNGDWQPGDIVFWKLDSGLDHVGMLTDQRGPSGNLKAIHNIDQPAEDDVLTAWKIVAHFRWRGLIS